MLRSLELGISLREWDVLTVGMILGFKTLFESEHSQDENEVRQATQADFDSF